MHHLRELVQETLVLIREKMEDSREWIAHSNEFSAQKIAPKEVEKEPKEKLTVASPLKPTEMISGRASALEQMEITLSHILGPGRLLPKPAEVYLVYFVKKPETWKFLESVSNAINEQLTKAEVIHCKDEKEFQKLLHTPYLKLVLATDRGKEVHQIEGKVLTMADVSEYGRDPQLKRALWNLLKSRFSPQSSSTLRLAKP